jgi:hypothetical protein
MLLSLWHALLTPLHFSQSNLWGQHALRHFSRLYSHVFTLSFGSDHGVRRVFLRRPGALA